MHNIANGTNDLSQRLPESGNDEVAQIAQAFNAFSDKLSVVMSLPLSGRRWERSLVPLAMLCIASRISDNRLSRRAIRMWTSAPLRRYRRQRSGPDVKTVC